MSQYYSDSVLETGESWSQDVKVFHNIYIYIVTYLGFPRIRDVSKTRNNGSRRNNGFVAVSIAMDTGVQKHYYGYECDTQENCQSRPKTRTDRTCTCVLRVIISGCVRS
jgi:hypothetical protein